MQNIFIGDTNFPDNVTIQGNLTVSGTTTTINTDVLQVKDGIIGVNIPPIINNDSGILIEKNYNNINDPDYTGTILNISATTANISQIAEIGWIIEAAGQKKLITFVSGNTVTVSPWSPVPAIGSAYNLYKNVNAGFFYKPTTNKFYTGFTYNTHLDTNLNITPGVLSVQRIEQSIGEQIWYVGKHGNDSLSGRTIGEAKLTFSAAGNNIVCLDSGVYTETVTVNGFVYAPNAKITNLILTGGKCVVSEFNTALCNGNNYLEFVNGGTINVIGGRTILSGQYLNGVTGILCTSATVIGKINNIDCVTAFNCENGTISVSADKNTSVNLANTNTNGIINTVASEINSYLETGSGIVYAADAKKIIDHINNTNNPHNVTLAQLVNFTGSGDLITYNGTNTIVLPRGLNTQILSVNNTNLEWINNYKTFSLHPEFSIINNINYVTVAYFTWIQNEFGLYNPGKLIFYVSVGTGVSVRLFDGINTYAVGNYNTTGYYTLNITNPTNNTVMWLQVRKNPGANGSIQGVNLIF